MAGSINFSADNIAKLKVADNLLKANNRNLVISSAGLLAGYIGGVLSVDPESHKAIRNVQGFAIGLATMTCGLQISERYFATVEYARRTKERGTLIDVEGMAANGELPTAKHMAANFAKYALAVGAPAAAIRGGLETYKLYKDGTLGEIFRREATEAVAAADSAVEEI